MGGFNRQRDLRSSNWFPAGRYAEMGKVHKASPDGAYEPHTIFPIEDPNQSIYKKQKAVMLAQVQVEAAMHSKPSTPGGARAFHTSAVGRGAHSYNEDHVVPDFYLQHKRRKNPESSDDTAPSNPPSSPTSKGPQTEVIVETHGSLMEQLSDSILSDDLAASTMRRLKSKTPHEHFNEDGILVHPSGFVIPTPGEAEVPMSEKRVRDINLQTAAVAERVQEEGSYTDINAHTRLQENKIPYEVIEEDGSVSHPSGFVPPTAAHEFKYSDSSSVDNHVQDAVQRQRRRATTIHLSNTEAEKRQKKSEAMFAMDEDDADLIAELKAGLKDVASKAKGGD